MEFAPICVYLVISLLLSLVLIGVSFLFASSSSLAYPEKLSAYECGFDPLTMPEAVLIYNFILFLFYLLYLIWKSPFYFLGQLLLTRLVCLDFGL
jgi:NADH-ubiquinone oxidoreductase chain 3